MSDYIFYSEDSYEDTPEAWTFAGFKKYFIETFHKIHNTGGTVPWTMKEQVLLSRMKDEHTGSELADMIMYWHINTHKPSVACQFANFYSSRVKIYHDMKKAQSDYSWD